MDVMALFDVLFPIARSITGDGVRQTLDILGEMVSIKKMEFPSGRQCFDWVVPQEWNIREAWVEDMRGRRVIDFKDSNLHVVGYSTPVDKVVSRQELLDHLHTLPELPGAIPYMTSYYQPRWGFCLEHNRLPELSGDKYRVRIDSTLEDGSLTMGEGYLQGETSDEIFFSTYVCHPSLANNELSGPIVQTFLYDYLRKRGKTRYSYRFVYCPETIGAIVYLSEFGEELKKRVKAGYVVTCVGDEAPFTYKRSRRGNSLADRAAMHALAYSGREHKVLDWFPQGSDERQYCSTGFNLPMGSLMRSMYGTYPQYHTSLDNRDFISEKGLSGSVKAYIDIIETLEMNGTYVNTNPFCEPNLGRRGLQTTLGGRAKSRLSKKAIKNFLAFSDGTSDLIAIADRMGENLLQYREELSLLVECGLLDPVPEADEAGGGERLPG